VDAQGLAVPGASVTITGPQGTRTVATDADGRFSIPFLVPGNYDVKAELQGFKTIDQKAVAVRLGQTQNLQLKMEVGGLTETVEVTGAAPIVDTRTTTIGANLNSDELTAIPVGRRVSDTLYLSPGVSSSGTLGTANPSISGSSGLENQYVVDGANVTNAGYGGLGAYSIVFGSLGNATPYDFVKEVQVKTGGYEAEFGQATGGVVNVITKSGTNVFRGSAFGYTQPTSIESGWKQFQSTNGSVQTVGTQVNDFGAEGGGPVVKNRLFLFGAIDPSYQRRVLHAPAGFPLESMGDVNRDRRTLSYATKATLQLGQGGHVDASFFGDPSHGKNGPQRTSALLVGDTSSFSTLDYGGHQQTVRYEGVLSSHFLLEASFARSDNKISEAPSVNSWRITDQSVTPTVITGGIGRFEAGNQSLNRQWTVKATDVFSGHQLKYGVEYSKVDYNQFNDITGPKFSVNGRQTATGATITVLPDVSLGKIFRVTRANFNNGHDTKQRYIDGFVQDSWKVGNRLTVNPGLRFDYESLDGDLVKGWKLKNNWAPRLGVTFDPVGDGRTKIYGNYGVFYARVPNDLAARALSADDGFSRIDYFDAGLTRPIPQGTVTQTTPGTAPVINHVILLGSGADDIDPNAKLSYTNEVVAGFEREIMSNTSFGVRYVFRNMPRVLEDISDCPMAAYEIPQTATAVPCGSIYLLTNPSTSTVVNPDAVRLFPAFSTVKFDNPIHKYNALEFTLNRRGTNWMGVASYRFSRLRGNFEGFYRDDNGQSDPGISSLYDFPTNDPTYTTFFPGAGDIRFLGQSGILPLDRPHSIKLYGNRVWGGLNIGGNISLNSGKPLTPMAANPVYDSDGEIPVAARGTGIQTVADSFRKRTPFESQIDLQASYTLMRASNRRVTFVADVFNLLNLRRVTGYDQDTQLDASTDNPDFGKPIATILSGNPPQFQAPRNLRLGVRFEF